VRRTEIWTAAGGSGYIGKPRPVVIVQDDHFAGTDSVTICAFTTDLTSAPLFRVAVVPDLSNRLSEPCSLMIDKITTVPKSKLGERIGTLGDDDMLRLVRSLIVFLGLAS